MKLRLLLLVFLCSIQFNVLLAGPPDYIQKRDAVIVFTDPIFTGTSNTVKFEVVSDNIIRVIAAPGKEFKINPKFDYCLHQATCFSSEAGQDVDASFNLYEDEGTNYNYEKGAFSIIPIKYNEATKTISIGDRKGSFQGMLEKRVFNINVISTDKKKSLDFSSSDKIVFYDGKKLTIKI